MVKWCNGVTKYAFTLVWCYGETNILQWCREYTNVHMVKWWNTSMKWCNNKDLHIIMVKWCNKSGEIVLIIQTSSHGKMVKQTSRDTLSAKWQNGETVILTFIIPLFCAPLRRWGQSPLLDSIRCFTRRLVYGQCRVDILIFPRAAPTPLYAVYPHCVWSMYFFFTFLLPLPTPGGFVPFCNILIIAIAHYSYADDILYYLCDTVTYTTFTSAIFSTHDLFAKVHC